MMARNSRALVCLFLAVFLLTSLIPALIYAQEQESARQKEPKQESQPVEKELAEKSQAAEQMAEKSDEISEEEIPEVIVPAPKDIKEATAIYVFLGWMWLSILVLIYLLRLKVKETDRIHQLKFFSKEKE